MRHNHNCGGHWPRMLDAGLWPEQKTKDSLDQKRRFRYDDKVLVDLVGKSISFHNCDTKLTTNK